MEGPTSVSALLHSATLVITGILISYHKVAIPSAPVLVGMFILGLVLLAITSDYDPDAKRVAAISTCTIIIVCWLRYSYQLTCKLDMGSIACWLQSYSLSWYYSLCVNIHYARFTKSIGTPNHHT